MPSQSPGIYIVLSGVVAAIISGIFSLWRESINDNLQLEREEKQRIWQLEQEKQQRIWQEKSEQKRWYRERICNYYEKLFHFLTKIMQAKFENENRSGITIDKHFNLKNLYDEFFCEFSKIIVNHPDKNSEEFKEKINKIIDELTDTTVDKDYLSIQVIIAEIMENDSRINGLDKY